MARSVAYLCPPLLAFLFLPLAMTGLKALRPFRAPTGNSEFLPGAGNNLGANQGAPGGARDSSLSGGYNTLGALYAVEQKNEAIQLCGECAESAHLHRNLGLIYGRTGNRQDGEKELRAALELDPHDEDAKRALALLENLPPAPPN